MDVLLVSFGVAVLALTSVLMNLDMEMDPKTNDYKALTELLPLGLVLVKLFNLDNFLFPLQYLTKYALNKKGVKIVENNHIYNINFIFNHILSFKSYEIYFHSITTNYKNTSITIF